MSAPQRFRKKPVEIEAMLLDAGTGDKLDGLSANDMAHAQIAGWMLGHGFQDFRVDGDHRPFGLVIATLEGEMRADPGDWIIRGVQGEFYPCKPDIFEQTYSEVREATPEDLAWISDGYREPDGTTETRDHNRFTARDKHPAAEHAYMVGWADGNTEKNRTPPAHATPTVAPVDDDELHDAARAELARNIAAYFHTIEPEVFVDGWVLVTHKRSSEWEQNGQSVVGITTPEQAWPLTRGLLDIALTEERGDQAE